MVHTAYHPPSFVFHTLSLSHAPSWWQIAPVQTTETDETEIILPLKCLNKYYYTKKYYLLD